MEEQGHPHLRWYSIRGDGTLGVQEAAHSPLQGETCLHLHFREQVHCSIDTHILKCLFKFDKQHIFVLWKRSISVYQEGPLSLH